MTAYYDDVYLISDQEFSFSFELRRKDKRIWAKILLMPRYKATEWIFPKRRNVEQ